MFSCFEEPINYFYRFYKQLFVKEPENIKNNDNANANDNAIVKFLLNDTNVVLENNSIKTPPRRSCHCVFF